MSVLSMGSVVLFLVLGSFSHLLAVELVVAETFDSNLNGWTLVQQPPTFAGSISWSPLDSGGLQGSGSIALTGDGSSAVAAEKCFPLTEATLSYVDSAKVLVANVESPIEVGFNFDFLPSTDCSGGGDLGVTVFFPLRSGAWSATIGSGNNLLFPNIPNDHSMLVSVQTDDKFKGTVYFDDIVVGTNVAAGYYDNRFVAGVVWKTSTGQIGVGTGVNLTQESAYFSYFDPSNIELVVKILNGCALNGDYWVFAAGLTNVSTLLDVQDQTPLSFGGIVQFTTANGPPFPPIEDTTALTTSCPRGSDRSWQKRRPKAWPTLRPSRYWMPLGLAGPEG